MKKFLFTAMCAFSLIFLSSCNKSAEEKELAGDNIYFFYQTTCSHCHDAAKYIKENHPDLKIISRDVRLPGNQKLFQTALRKYKITSSAGTPLICFGDNYIMGWSESKIKKFEEYSKPYKK